MSTELATRPVGRPRDEQIEQRVLDAAVELLQARPAGEEFTLAELVEASGVSRAAIYRRWENRNAILVAALDHARSPVHPAPKAARLREQLIETYRTAINRDSPEEFNLIRKRLVLALKDPKLQAVYWQRHVSRRRKVMIELLTTGQESGEIRVDADLEATVDLINGSVYYQIVVRGDVGCPDSRQRLESAIDIVWRGIATQ